MPVNLDQQLSANFLLRELLISDYATRNNITEQYTPSDPIVRNLRALCTNILQPLRDKTRRSVHITSGYRCERTNSGIGGAPTSQHLKGQAADIHQSNRSTEELYQYIKKSGIPFDQLIQEFDRWVHISYNPSLKKQRGQCLRATKDSKGRTVYTNDNL